MVKTNWPLLSVSWPRQLSPKNTFQKIDEIYKNQNTRPNVNRLSGSEHTNENRNLMQITGNRSSVVLHVDDGREFVRLVWNRFEIA